MPKTAKLGKRRRTPYARPSAYVRGKLLRPYGGATAMDIAVARANKIVSRVGELKGVDTVLTDASIIATTNTNGDCYVLNLCQAGTGSWNRIGKKIRMKSLRLYGVAALDYVPNGTTGNLLSNMLRMVVVYDKQPSGAAIPTFDAVFGHTEQDGAEGSIFVDPVRYDNSDRFRVIKDLRIPFNVPTHNAGASMTTTNSTRIIVPFDEYVELRGLETIYSGQSTPMTITDVSTGGLYIYFRSLAASADSIVSVLPTSFARLRYSDL